MSEDRTDQIIPLGVENPDAQRARGLFAWIEKELPEEEKESAILSVTAEYLSRPERERQPPVNIVIRQR